MYKTCDDDDDDERETHLPESQRKRTNGRRNAETETDSVIHVTHVVAERDRERD